jgi:hypothetical protein
MQRRGVVGGIDYMATGEVKRIDVSRIRERLDANCIVIVSNLGYSSSGQVLNCKYVRLYHFQIIALLCHTWNSIYVISAKNPVTVKIPKP